MKRTLLIVLAVFMLVAPALAQETLTPNTPVTGEITNDEFAFAYTFTASAGEAYMFEMKSVEDFSDLSSPQLILQSQGLPVVNTNEIFQFFGPFGAEYIAFEVQADGEYSLVATRVDGAAGDSVGEYTLEMIAPTALEPGSSVEATISSESTFDYYVYQGDDPFSIVYEKSDGDYWPEVSINIVDEDGSIKPLGFIVGDAVTRGTMGNFEGGRTYFIVVGQLNSGFTSDEFYFDEAMATYTLSVKAAE